MPEGVARVPPRSAEGRLYQGFRVEAKGLEPSNLLTASQALYQLSYAPGAEPQTLSAWLLARPRTGPEAADRRRHPRHRLDAAAATSVTRAGGRGAGPVP